MGEGIAAPQANEVVSLTVSGTTMNHTVLEGESFQDIVNGMRVLINGVWADNNYGTRTTLRIQSKAPSWSFPGLAVPDGLARLLGATTGPFEITAGSNDALQFTIGGEGGTVVPVTLTAGAARTRSRSSCFRTDWGSTSEPARGQTSAVPADS